MIVADLKPIEDILSYLEGKERTQTSFRTWWSGKIPKYKYCAFSCKIEQYNKKTTYPIKKVNRPTKWYEVVSHVVSP